ncbi:MAG: putative signal transduction protein, partial [Frankiales bacterium]|nr:putative signal transduction protein [Frankiales bacterium]
GPTGPCRADAATRSGGVPGRSGDRQERDTLVPGRHPIAPLTDAPVGAAVPAQGGIGVVERLLSDVDHLPGRQPVLLRLAQLVDDPDSSTRDLAELSAADPAFTSRLLRLANSAYYGRAGTVTSLVPAIGVIGRTSLRTTALAMALGLSGEHGSLPAGFWGRAGLVAASAQLVARDLGAAPGDALCAGLLCDLGQALLYRAAPAAYGRLVASASDDALAGAERAWCGLSHAELGARVLRTSGVPAALCAAIEQHHDVAPDGGPLAVAVRVGVLVSSDDASALEQLGPLTDGLLEAADAPRLALSAAAGAAALSSALG